jgi:low affinity Fe/Cu permease
VLAWLITIVTFLMVFLIQNTQNRDSEAMQLKLDELLRASQDAHNALLDIEELSEQELDQIKRRYESLAREATSDVRSGKSDLGTPDVIKRKSKRSQRGNDQGENGPARER